MKPLRVVDPNDSGTVVDAIREALAGSDAVCVSAEPVSLDAVPDNCALVVLTSGSTARPKKVMLSGDSLRASTRATRDAIGTGRWVLALPLTYIAGLMVVVRSLEAGTEPEVYDSDNFAAESFSEFVNALPEDRWFTALVPTQLARLVDAAETDSAARDALMRFDAILVGGQAIPAGLIERAAALGARVIKTYGSAETAGGVVYDGEPIGDTQLRIGTDGVLEILSASLASGYAGDAKLTVQSFRDGWFRTSDLATLVDGRLVINGRVDDVIVTGGVKVSLADIERVLGSAGIEAIATWFPDDEWGQVPALVTTKPVDLAEARDIVESALGKAARPFRVAVVTTIPLLSSGKVDRVAVREIARTAQP